MSAISDWRAPPLFITASGVELACPPEWADCRLVLPGVSTDQWQKIVVSRQGQNLPVRLESVGRSVRVCTAWTPANAGHHSIAVQSQGERVEHRVTVVPEKMSAMQFAALVTELEERLPASIAMALDKLGAFARISWKPPAPRTLAQELVTVRHALNGDDASLGLLSLLPDIARRPHQVLHEQEQWRFVQAARRPHPQRLDTALSKPGNVVERLPLRVVDRRAVTTYDVYENRLVSAFAEQVDRRLRLLERAATRDDAFGAAHGTALQGMRRGLDRALRDAAFLDEVGPLRAAPDRVTQVLLRCPAYRAAYSGFMRFRRVPRLSIDHLALDAPLLDVPSLYEAWGVVVTIEAMLDVARHHGWQAGPQTLVVPSKVAPLVRVLPGGPVLSLHRGMASATLLYQQQIGQNGKDLRSISYPQRPDLILDVWDGKRRALHVFDPKYKLARSETGSTEPLKPDIDKMHAYRDAIRDEAGNLVVRSAAILYPGDDRTFATPEIAAHQLLPGRAHDGLRASIARVLV